MKKTILCLAILLIFGTLLAESVQLNNFEELMDALKQGERVRVIIHYGQCQLINNNEIKESSPDAIGGMNIDTFEYFAPMSIGNPTAFVAFSHASLINLRGFVYNYAKFRVNADNTVKMTAQYAEPNTFELDMNENFFTEINNGKNEGACYFYKLD
jgi:propanediol utilization protein